MPVDCTALVVLTRRPGPPTRHLSSVETEIACVSSKMVMCVVPLIRSYKHNTRLSLFGLLGSVRSTPREPLTDKNESVSN
ncbi:hypothetical protein BRADI_5g12063v3 [Brachypodium distachyon]|uniref:Uncharacterized protein n=1 Tax=Brachypodium distachyon TaxID=15368 RepID=A0A0Q3I9X1_BRADI|nr:hypothetical protein BRADI_5g12063v3 [Brachypodium distachyon]